MADKTDVINVALRLVGASRITSVSDGSNEADVANDLWDQALDDVLREHNWHFAMKNLKLARLSDVPAFEFSYAYGMPDDWVRTVAVYDNDGANGTLTCREQLINDKRALFADAEDVYLRYVSKVTNVGIMPGDFRRALACRLAIDFAVPLANSAAVMQTAQAAYGRALMKARATDSLGSTPESRPPGTWATVRSTWGGSSFQS